MKRTPVATVVQGVQRPSCAARAARGPPSTRGLDVLGLSRYSFQLGPMLLKDIRAFVQQPGISLCDLCDTPDPGFQAVSA